MRVANTPNRQFTQDRGEIITVAGILQSKGTQRQPRGDQRGLSVKDTGNILGFHLAHRKRLNYSRENSEAISRHRFAGSAQPREAIVTDT